MVDICPVKIYTVAVYYSSSVIKGVGGRLWGEGEGGVRVPFQTSGKDLHIE